MFARIVDHADRLAARHSAVLSLLAAGWFAITCASYAGFIRLPELGLLSDRAALGSGMLINAIWWGFLYPRAQTRRAERASEVAQADRAPT